MKNVLAKYSTWKLILPSFIAFAVCLYLFQSAQNDLSTIAGEPVVIIDMMPNYDKALINDFFTNIKPEGIAIHKFITSVVDMIFPIAYGVLFILLLAFFIKKILGPESNWMYLSLIPLALMIFDYQENFRILGLIDSFPDLDVAKVDRASSSSSIKSILTNVCFGMIVLFGLVLGSKTIYNRLK